jgi:hypothetical protein
VAGDLVAAIAGMDFQDEVPVRVVLVFRHEGAAVAPFTVFITRSPDGAYSYTALTVMGGLGFPFA